MPFFLPCRHLVLSLAARETRFPSPSGALEGFCVFILRFGSHYSFTGCLWNCLAGLGLKRAFFRYLGISSTLHGGSCRSCLCSILSPTPSQNSNALPVSFCTSL